MKLSRWSRGDVFWESCQERAAFSWLRKKRIRAKCLWHLAYVYALLFFNAKDPRMAVSLANASLLAKRAGRESLARRRLEKALSIWATVPAWIEEMHIARRARTSLYHLRLELVHWSIYEANLRRRMRNFADETDASLQALAGGRMPPHRHFARWRGEKPAIRDDTRKLLSACLLLADVLVMPEDACYKRVLSHMEEKV